MLKTLNVLRHPVSSLIAFSATNITDAQTVSPKNISALTVWYLTKISKDSTNVTNRSTLIVETERNCVSRLTFKFMVLRIRGITHSEPPRGTNDYCPRKNGIFSHPDETVCDVFYTCVDGEYIENKCVGGLHFDEYSGTCVWPDSANRENCQEKKKELKDGFICPKDQNKNDRSGQVIAHPHYAHPTDCQKAS